MNNADTAERFTPVCLCGNEHELSRCSVSFRNSRTLWKCRRCDLYQLHPYPITPETAESFYARDNYLSKINEEEYRGYFLALFHHVLAPLINKASAILDFGAGYCYYHRFLNELGYQNVTSLEVNPNLVSFARDKLHLSGVVTSAKDICPQSIDLVIANHVVEHLLDPREILAEVLLPLVKPSGVIVLAMPNASSLNRIVLGNRWVAYSPEEHIWFFNERSAKTVFGSIPGVEFVSASAHASINTRFDRFVASTLVKRMYYATVMRLFETLGRGDQLIVMLKKSV